MTRARGPAVTGFVLAWLAGCAELDYQRCDGTVCPVGTACCGTACVAASCGDGVRDDGEACDQTTGASCYGADATLGDFGQLGCTGGCELDAAPCGRFGFVADRGLPCPVVAPIALTASGTELWIATTEAVVRIADRTCTAIARPSIFARLAALDGAVVVAGNRLGDGGATVAELGVIVDDRLQVLPTTATNPVRQAIIVDRDTVAVRRAGRVLTLVTRTTAGWTARDLVLGCAAATGVANAGRRIDTLAVVDRHLVFALHEPDLAKRDTVIGAVPLPTLLASASPLDAPRCVAATGAPSNAGYVDSAGAADGTYLVGAGQFTDGSRGAVVVRVSVDGTGTPATITILGEATPVALQRLTAIDHATIGAAGEVIVHQGPFALTRRQGRWRGLTPTPRQVLDAVAIGATTVAVTPTGVMTSRGHGYQVLHDFRQASGVPLCDPGLGQVCRVLATGRDLTSEWLLAATNPAGTSRLLVRDGIRVVPRVESVAVQPRRLAFGQDAAWVAARSSALSSLWLLRGSDDPRPVLAVAGATAVEVERLSVGPVRAAALVRATFPGEPEVSLIATRTAADGSGLIAWRTATIDDLAVVPVAGGGDAIVAVVTNSTGASTFETVLHRVDGSANPPVLARLSGDRTIRAIWGPDLDHLWLAGDDGVLLRYQDGVLEDRSATLGERTDLRALTGTGPADVFVSGLAGALHHFDGQAWTAVAPPSRPADLTELRLEGDELRLAAGEQALALRIDRAAPPAPVCAP